MLSEYVYRLFHAVATLFDSRFIIVLVTSVDTESIIYNMYSVSVYCRVSKIMFRLDYKGSG